MAVVPPTVPPADTPAAPAPTVAGIPLSRLTNTQYDNAVLDLLGVAGAPSDAFPVLPPDDTRADPYPLVKAYWEAAEQVAGLAFGAGGKFEMTCVGATGEACAREFIMQQGRLLYRRTLTEADVQPLLKVWTDGVALGYREALRRTLATMLMSPSFLYRVELPGSGKSPVALTPDEIATRLAFAAWNSVPTAELLDLAARGGLATGAQRVAELEKMLASDKGKRMVRDFAARWLGSRQVLEVKKDVKGFDDGVAKALAQETEDFVASVVLAGGGFVELLTADHSLVTDKLKALYGITTTSKTPVKVTMPAGQRSGILTHGSLLAIHATPTEPSPISRGVFVYESLLCLERPGVPVNVPPLPGADLDGKALTQRERLQLHRENPACKGCHAIFDGFGLALEQYDAIGRHAPTEAGKPLTGDGEASDLDGKPAKFRGAIELGKLLAGSATARRCFAQRALESVAGHDLAPSERSLLDDVASSVVATGELRTVFTRLVAHDAFTRRTFGSP